MDCSDMILSDDTYEFIVTADESRNPAIRPVCIQPLSDKYAIWYYNRAEVPSLSLDAYTYASIPKCFGLLDSVNLEASGILKLQNQPTLSLKGQGVFVAVIDTGVSITDDAFRNNDGSTRIFSYWDQTGAGIGEVSEEQSAPEGFLYGTEYTKTQINEVLSGENPKMQNPDREEMRHGTFLASVACGSENPEADFVGAAPYSELIVVKLKKAKQYLKDYYFIPQGTTAYAETDIMAGVAYAQRIAEREDRPLVVFLGLGTNNGSHAGTSPLCDYLDTVGTIRHRAVVVASGNEANNRHHFLGRTESMLSPFKVELNVENDMPGFYAEVWVPSTGLIAVSVQSPTGEIVPKSTPYIVFGEQRYTFLFEDTRLSINYIIAGRTRRDQLIFLHFTNAVKGIWTIYVYPQSSINENFHIWLPMKGMLSGDVFFLRPNPETTLTMPSDAAVPMTVGGYNGANGALYLESGRGFDAVGRVKPDFLAPAVDVEGSGPFHNLVAFTGTSAASAITAGGCAQILEWAVPRRNAVGINSVDIKNMLIRGCRRNSEQEYPTPELGFGLLDVYQAFLDLR